jgi:hypothetical protein
MRGMFRKKAVTAPSPIIAPSTEPLRLKCGSLEFLVGFTTRRAIETRLGPAVEYPAPGWRTWAAAGNRGDCWILSAIYRGHVLIGVEHYVAKTENLPRDTPPANGLYTLVPGDVQIGMPIKQLPDRFRSLPGAEGSARSIVFQQAYEARWPHGIAFVCGNNGRIERLALYANHEMPTIARSDAQGPSGV